MESLQVTDKQAQDVAVAPRVQLKDIEDAIVARYDVTADKAVATYTGPVASTLKLLSICILVMENGFIVVGKSAPASADNFNAELGKKFAYEDAIRQLWPLMGYALRDRTYHGW